MMKQKSLVGSLVQSGALDDLMDLQNKGEIDRRDHWVMLDGGVSNT